jgi:hypothetical protein
MTNPPIMISLACTEARVEAESDVLAIINIELKFGDETTLGVPPELPVSPTLVSVVPQAAFVASETPALLKARTV